MKDWHNLELDQFEFDNWEGTRPSARNLIDVVIGQVYLFTSG